jgi:hypothetical protein
LVDARQQLTVLSAQLDAHNHLLDVVRQSLIPTNESPSMDLEKCRCGEGVNRARFLALWAQLQVHEVQIPPKSRYLHGEWKIGTMLTEEVLGEYEHAALGSATTISLNQHFLSSAGSFLIPSLHQSYFVFNSCLLVYFSLVSFVAISRRVY